MKKLRTKLYSLMKITLTQIMLITAFSTVSFARESFSQDVLNRIVTIEAANKSLKTVLTDIEKEADIHFAYQPQVVVVGKVVSVTAKEQTLASILDKVLGPLSIQYEVAGNYIVLSKAQGTSNEKATFASNVAPNVLITGTVLDEKNEPLVGASVVVKGTTTGAITDIDGKFSLSIPEGDATLLVQYIGYESKEIAVGKQRTFTIILEGNDKTLNELVVVGYGTANRKDILGAVGSVKDKDIEQITPVNTFDAMQGRLAGVQISSNGGPGSGSDIRIRGTSTFSGGVNPLYIVDGQQLEDINNLNPNDIANIEILKDGASAAIYGSKSANGVVVITTKAGKAGEMKLNVDYARSISNLASSISIANTRERIYYENARAGNDPLAIPADSLNLLFQNSNDLNKLLTRPSDRHQINATLSGGGANSRFYWNTGFLDEQGVVVNSSYQRFSSRLKMDADYKKRLTASSMINLSYEFQKGLSENAVFQQLAERIPYYPIFEPDGSFTPEIAGRQNPLAEAIARTTNTRNFRVQNFNYLQLQILPSLTLRSTLGVNFRMAKENIFEPTIVQTVGRPITGSESVDLSHDFQHEDYFTFKKQIGKHKIAAIAGWQIQRWNEEGSGLSATSFSSDNIQTFNNVSELNTAGTTSDRSGHSLTAIFGDVSYDYKGKYLAKGTLRRDGSSRFGSDKLYGLFPSGSIGWRVSGEDFLKNVKSIDNLMLRYSFGTNGNERIGNYESRLLYRPGARYNGLNGVSPFQLANPLLGWESTESQNLGMDLMLYKNRIGLNVDLWDKTTKDLLYSVPLPEETGFSSVRQNIGSVQNRGIDINLTLTPIRQKGFEWTTSFNITFLRNKVVDLADDDGFESGNFIIEEGQPLGNFYGYRNLGVFRYNESNAFANDGTQLTPIFDDGGKFQKYQLNGTDYAGTINRLKVGAITLLGGDIRWEDRNNDFQIDGVNDRSVLGNGLATHFGGLFNEFKYKNLSLSFLFDFNFGNNIFRNYDQQRNDLNSTGETPSPERIKGAWLKPGDVAEYASLGQTRTQNRLGPNSQYISKGDYIKWRNVRLNYVLPKSMLKQLKVVNRMSFYVSVNNLVTLTNYIGFNPELGSRGNPLQPGHDNLRYPNKRDFIGGLSVQF